MEDKIEILGLIRLHVPSPVHMGYSGESGIHRLCYVCAGNHSFVHKPFHAYLKKPWAGLGICESGN